MLDAGLADTQLALRLDEARHRVDLLISEGIHSGALAALTSVDSHYDDIDYDAMGQGYLSRKFDVEILAIGNFRRSWCKSPCEQGVVCHCLPPVPSLQCMRVVLMSVSHDIGDPIVSNMLHFVCIRCVVGSFVYHFATFSLYFPLNCNVLCYP